MSQFLRDETFKNLTIEETALQRIAVFLIFSNLWTLIIRWIGWTINKWWPNISFKKPRLMHWLLQGIVATLIAGAAIFIIGKLNVVFSRLLTHILK